MITISKDKLNSGGVLYVLLISLDEGDIVKVGITSRKVEERVVEITTSIWKHYRYFPRVYVKKYKRVADYEAKEQVLLGMFKDKQHKPKHKFSGCTECFDVELDEVVKAYDELDV